MSASDVAIVAAVVFVWGAHGLTADPLARR